MPKYPIRPTAYTDQPLAKPGFCNSTTVNLNTTRGYLWPDRGYKKFRQIVAQQDTPGQRLLHRQIDGSETPVYINGTQIAPETGSDSPATMATGVTATWNWATTPFGAPTGMTILLNGTFADAKLVRGGGPPTAVDFNGLVEPAAVTLGTNTAGGSIAAGTYLVRQAWLDDDSNIVSVEGEITSVGDSQVTTGATSIITVPEPSPAPARATKRRIYVSSVNATDVITNFFLETTVAKAFGTVTLTSLTGTTNPPNRNGLGQTAVMPEPTARYGVKHLDRLIIAGSNKNEIYWSERDNPNQWHSTNSISGFGGFITGLASLGGTLFVFTRDEIYRVDGDFSRDTTGPNPLFAARVSQPIPISEIGCVSHATITRLHNSILFLSTQGPAILTQGGAQPLIPEHFQNTLDCLDLDNIDRASAAVDFDNHLWCCLVPRLTNASRAMDGASTAGIPDLIIRYDWRHGVRCPDLKVGDLTHISSTPNGTVGAQSLDVKLMGMGPHGYCVELQTGTSGGGATSAATDANNNGKLASSFTATTAVIEASGTLIDALIGQSLMIYYPTVDTTYPGVFALKTISDNTAESGGTLTVTWKGSLPLHSSTLPTLRVAGLPVFWRCRHDARDYVQGMEPGQKVILVDIGSSLHPVAEIEAIS